MILKIETLEDLKLAQSKVMRLMNQYKALGSETPYIDAAGNVAPDYGMTGKELMTTIAKSNHELNTVEKSDETPTSGAGMYRAWVEDNDHVPSDLELAHFTGNSTATYARARHGMINERGYAFQRDELGIGWTVISRPQAIKKNEQRMYSKQELANAVEAAIKSLGK